MNTKEFLPWLVGFLVLLLFASPVFAGGPLLVASDLDTEIQNLPQRCTQDPILPLEKRLAELKTANPGSHERRALKQAVSLILIFRQTRISSTTPR